MTKIGILSSHNGSGFDAINDAISNNKLVAKIEVVISNNSNAPVLQKAKNNNIKTFVVNAKTDENVDQKIYNLLKENGCKFIFLSGYMKQLSSLITSNFKVLNSHPSLLPKYGGIGMYGKFVHKAVLENKEKLTGVTIHEVNENYDEGKVILQKKLLLSEGETIEGLELKIKSLEQLAIVEALQEYLTIS